MTYVILLCLTGIAVWFDVRTDRIPNLLCITGATIGAALAIYVHGTDGLISLFVQGTLIFMLLFPVWCLGVLGGGDVKLFLMCSCFLVGKGKEFLMISGVFLAVYAFFLMVYRRNLRCRIWMFADYVRHCIVDETLYAYPFNRKKTEEVRAGGFHVSLGICAGLLYGIFHGLI